MSAAKASSWVLRSTTKNGYGGLVVDELLPRVLVHQTLKRLLPDRIPPKGGFSGSPTGLAPLGEPLPDCSSAMGRSSYFCQPLGPVQPKLHPSCPLGVRVPRIQGPVTGESLEHPLPIGPEEPSFHPQPFPFYFRIER